MYALDSILHNEINILSQMLQESVGKSIERNEILQIIWKRTLPDLL